MGRAQKDETKKTKKQNKTHVLDAHHFSRTREVSRLKDEVQGMRISRTIHMVRGTTEPMKHVDDAHTQKNKNKKTRTRRNAHAPQQTLGEEPADEAHRQHLVTCLLGGHRIRQFPGFQPAPRVPYSQIMAAAGRVGGSMRW